jgi:hypothetical protein
LSKDQIIGTLIFTVCIALMVCYIVALFWPALEAIRLWLVAIPVLIAFTAILGIGAWIGWTMTTTPPPKPIEEIRPEQTEEETRSADK